MRISWSYAKLTFIHLPTRSGGENSMASGQGQVLTTLVAHKQESLQYLTVDMSTYLHWRTLARCLDLSTDCDVAAFLLQYYEKTSELLQLTQCVKCCGPVVQYCVSCNIYMTQPTPPTALLQQDGSTTLTACDDSVLPSDTILLDFGDAVEVDQLLSQDIAVKTHEDTLAEEMKGINAATTILLDAAGGISGVLTQEPERPSEPSKLRMLMEACSREAVTTPSVSLSAPKPQPKAKSLLTPDVLQKLQSRLQEESSEPPVVVETCTTATASTGVHNTSKSQTTLKSQTAPSQTAQSQAAQSKTIQSQSTTESQGSASSAEPASLPGSQADLVVTSTLPESMRSQIRETSEETAALDVSDKLLPVQSQPSVKLEPTSDAQKMGQFQVVEEGWGSEDEDSDYHCAPLFTTQHSEEDYGPVQTGVGSHKKDLTSQHDAGTVRSYSHGASSRQSSNRKQAGLHIARKDATHVKCEPFPVLTDKHNSHDSQVIIVTDHVADQNIDSKEPSKTEETKQSQQPLYRSKRIAERLALKSDAKKLAAKSSADKLAAKANAEKLAVMPDDAERPVIKSELPMASPKVSIMVYTPSKSSASARPKIPKSRAYTCRFCPEQFEGKLDRTLHIREKHGERPYACGQCTATYTTSGHLKMHMLEHADIKPFPCSSCPSAFSRGYDLKIHQMTHNTERPYVCEICGVGIKTFRRLTKHMRTHNDHDKPFICQQCGKTFRWKSNLNDHLRTHTNEKPFACPEPGCGVRCIQSGSLKRHIERKHNPHRLRPYVCHICGESRFDKIQFKKHMMIHTGEKPWKCDICGAAFIQVNALAGHKKIHTEREGKPHMCGFCGAAFLKLSSVTKHMNKVHRSKLPENAELPVMDMEVITLQ